MSEENLKLLKSMKEFVLIMSKGLRIMDSLLAFVILDCENELKNLKKREKTVEQEIVLTLNGEELARKVIKLYNHKED